MKGYFVSGLSRVGIWGRSTGAVVASAVAIIYICDLNEGGRDTYQTVTSFYKFLIADFVFLYKNSR